MIISEQEKNRIRKLHREHSVIKEQWEEVNIDEQETSGTMATDEEIKGVQEYCKNTLKMNMAVDGKYGPKTTECIKKIQVEQDLTVDGKLGPWTHGWVDAAEQASGVFDGQ